MGLQRVRHDRVISVSLFPFMHWRRKWQPTPVFLPGESRDGGAWWAAVYGVTQSWTRLKRLSSSSRDYGAWQGSFSLRSHKKYGSALIYVWHPDNWISGQREDSYDLTIYIVFVNCRGSVRHHLLWNIQETVINLEVYWAIWQWP